MKGESGRGGLVRLPLGGRFEYGVCAMVEGRLFMRVQQAGVLGVRLVRCRKGLSSAITMSGLITPYLNRSWFLCTTVQCSSHFCVWVYNFHKICACGGMRERCSKVRI